MVSRSLWVRRCALICPSGRKGSVRSFTALQRPTMYRGGLHIIPDEKDDYLREHVAKCAVDVQQHVGHRPMCFKMKGNINKNKCRYGIASVQSVLHENETEVREVEVQMDESGQPEFWLKPPTRPIKNDTIWSVLDERSLIVLLRNNQDPTQDTKRGSLIVPYNETLTACVRCNTCVVFIGSEGPGIKIMQYLIKYMSKDIGPPVYIVPALRAANDHLRRGLNSEHRVQTDIPMARLLLQKLSNMTHRKRIVEHDTSEASIEMATAFCLGQPSEYMSHTSHGSM